MNSRMLPILFVTACAVLGHSARAQQFPSKPVHIIIPFAPGGGNETIARSIAPKLAEKWGQPVIVENKPGAASTIGANFVAKAPADGHTILLTGVGIVIAQYAYANLPYDTLRDLAPVAMLTSSPLVLLVDAARSPIKSLPEFVAVLKKNPGKLTYGTPGEGSVPHLAFESFRMQQPGISALHVPYKGTSQAITDLLGGQVDFIFNTPIGTQSFLTSGKLRALAVTAERRTPYWPDVPTFKEGGYGDYTVNVWTGVFVPTGTPKDVVSKLNADIVAALKSPDVAARLTEQGADVAGTTSEEFGKFLVSEHARWSATVKATKLKAQ